MEYLENYFNSLGVDHKSLPKVIGTLAKLGIDEAFPFVGGFIFHLIRTIEPFASNYEIHEDLDEIVVLREYFASFNKSLIGRQNTLEDYFEKYPFAACIVQLDQSDTEFFKFIKTLCIESVLRGKYSIVSPIWAQLRLLIFNFSSGDIDSLEKEYFWESIGDNVLQILQSDFLEQWKESYGFYVRAVGLIEQLLTQFISKPPKEKDRKQELYIHRVQWERGIVATRHVSGSRFVNDEYMKLSMFLKKEIDGVNSSRAAVIIVSLITGRSIADSEKLLFENISNIAKEGCIKKPVVIINSLKKDIYVKQNGHLKVPVPDVLVKWASGSVNEIAIKDMALISKCKSMMLSLKKETQNTKRISLKRIQGALRKEVNLNLDNPIKSYLLCCNEIDEPPLETHYNFVDNEIYRDWLSILEIFGFEVTWSDDEPFHYGCKIKEDIVKRYFDNLIEEIESATQGRDAFKIHNYFTKYIINALMLGTGCRFVVDPFSSWNDIDLVNALIKIWDKQIESIPFRYLPLSKILVTLLQSYKTHLKNLASILLKSEKYSNGLVRCLLDLSEGKAVEKIPLFFLFENNGSIKSIKGIDIKPYGCEFVPANIGRKVCAAELSQRINMNASRAILGHTHCRIPFLGQKSFNNPDIHEEIVAVIDRILSKYSILPKQGLTGRNNQKLQEKYEQGMLKGEIQEYEIRNVISGDKNRADQFRKKQKHRKEIFLKAKHCEISLAEISEECKKYGINESQIINRLSSDRIESQRRYDRTDFYRGGKSLLDRLKLHEQISRKSIEILTNKDNLKSTNLPYLIVISIVINSRVASSGLLNKIIENIMPQTLIDDEQGLSLVINNFDHYSKNPWSYEIDSFTAFLAKIYYERSDVAINKKVNKRKLNKILKAFVGVPNIEELLKTQNAKNAIELDAGHTDFLASRLRSTGLGIGTFNRRAEPNRHDLISEVAKIGLNQRNPYRRILQNKISEFEKADEMKVKADALKKKRLSSFLRSILNNEKMSPVEILIANWGIQLCEEKTSFNNVIRSSSIVTYMSYMSSFLRVLGDIDLLNLSIFKQQQAIERCFNEYVGDQRTIFQRFEEFDFFMKQFSSKWDVDLIDIEEEIDSKKRKIDNNIVTFEEYLRIHQYLEKFEHSDVLRLALIIFYRFGVRPSEGAFLLQSDCFLTSKEEILVNIEANKYRTLKNPNAKRLVRQAEILEEFEIELVKRRLSVAQDHQLLYMTDALLLHPHSQDDSDFIDKLIATIQEAIKQITNDRNLSIYNFRHAYSSRLIYLIHNENSEIVFLKPLAQGSKLCPWIDAIPSIGGKYAMISQLMGHSTINVTLENYDHVSQYFWQRKVCEESRKALYGLSGKALSILTGRNSSHLRVLKHRDKNFIDNRLIKPFEMKIHASGFEDVEIKNISNEPKRFDLKAIDLFLTKYLNSEELFHQEYGFDMELLKLTKKHALSFERKYFLSPYKLHQRSESKSILIFPKKKQRLFFKWCNHLSDSCTNEIKQSLADAYRASFHQYRKLFMLEIDEVNKFASDVEFLFKGNILIDHDPEYNMLKIIFLISKGSEFSKIFISRLFFLIILEAEITR